MRDIEERQARHLEDRDPGRGITLLEALARHPRVAAAIVVGFLALGLVLAFLPAPDYEATSRLILEDPRASRLFDVGGERVPSNVASERYLADQVEILRSPIVAEVASESTGSEIPAEALLRRQEVVGDATSNLIEVSFVDESPERAKAGADALAEAYVEVRQNQVRETADAALARVDAQREALDRDLAEIGSQIEQLASQDPQRVELRRQLDEAVTRLNEIRVQRDASPIGSAERAALNAQIDELLRDFTAWEVVLGIESTDPDLAALLATRDAAITERAALASARNDIVVNAELAAGGVSLFSPATLPDEPAGLPPVMIVVISLALGLATAVVVAYYRSIRRSVFTSRFGPEAVVGAPLLSEIPRFQSEGIRSQLPVLEAPASLASEAFRFAAAGIDLRMASTGARRLLVVSANARTGKTTVVANAGIVAASSGLRVLLVDADFGNQELTQHLDRLGTAPEPRAASGKGAVAGIERVTLPDGHTLSLLAPGRQGVEAVEYLRSDKTAGLFAALPDRFDLVLVDGPPLLHVAYSSLLSRHADAAVIVVEHGSRVGELEELSDRLELIGLPTFGYVYTKAPLRDEALEREGSVARFFEGLSAHPAEMDGDEGRAGRERSFAGSRHTRD